MHREVGSTAQSYTKIAKEWWNAHFKIDSENLLKYSSQATTVHTVDL